PFELVVCPLGWARSEAVRDTASRLHDALAEAGIDVILDDRGERPGVMFAEWELVGVPGRINVGDRGLAEGQVELVERRGLQTRLVAVDAVVREVVAALRG